MKKTVGNDLRQQHCSSGDKESYVTHLNKEKNRVESCSRQYSNRDEFSELIIHDQLTQLSTGSTLHDSEA